MANTLGVGGAKSAIYMLKQLFYKYKMIPNDNWVLDELQSVYQQYIGLRIL